MRLFLFISLAAAYIYPQCSDAGICSITDSYPSSAKNLRTGILYEFGYSGSIDDISYSSIVLKADYDFSENTSTHLSIPYSFQSGPDGSASGMGDLLLLINQNILNQDNISLGVQGGVKFSVSDDNLENLPQMYQSSLGTTDFLFGVSLTYNNFNLASGYQVAGTRNSNILKVKRGNDFLFSAGYDHSFYKDLNATVKLLVIKRLSETSIADTSTPGNYINIDGSDNLQINAALSFAYMISESVELNLFGAVPFKKRPVNTDGLTRSLSLNAGLFFHL